MEWADQMIVICFGNRTIGTINSFRLVEVGSRLSKGRQLLLHSLADISGN
jgi:hypothetical protein